MDQPLYILSRGSTPLLIDVPHAGTHVPAEIAAGMTPLALTVPDTDWHVPSLYQHALERGAGLMAATHSRYVIDLNRDPQDVALYPGADNTELCPRQSFANEPLYRAGREPDAIAVRRRREIGWAPYHAALRAELERLRAEHGYAVLLDAHSIRSRVPRFFEGRLPDLNLGTADGRSCAADLRERAMTVLRGAAGFSAVLDGRFKGGYITRHYGQPGEGVHALQLEIAQACYMDEERPRTWSPAPAMALVEVLRSLVEALLRWRPD